MQRSRVVVMRENSLKFIRSEQVAARKGNLTGYQVAGHPVLGNDQSIVPRGCRRMQLYSSSDSFNRTQAREVT
jgi:hypothetical protein